MDTDNISREYTSNDNVTVSNEKVMQTIVYGSPYEALIRGFVTYGDILNYLLDEDISHRTMIAYRAVCQFSTDQIVTNHENPDFNDKPFITVTTHKEYVGIYYLSIGNKGGRNDKERVEIAKCSQKVLPKLMNINSFSRIIHLLCDSNRFEIKNSELRLIVGARSINTISRMLKELEAHFDLWLDNDYLGPIENIAYSFYENELLTRCELLKTEAPLYWDAVGMDLYRYIVIKNLDITSDIPLKQIRRYDNLFSGIFPEELVNVSDFEYYMKELTEITQAYVLGYPIHRYVPTSKTIKKTIDLVKKIGIDEYVRIIEDQNMKSLTVRVDMINPWRLDKNDKDNKNKNESDDKDDKNYIILANQQDVLMEDISAYNSFDVTRYYTDTHLYFFTRPEHSDLIANKKNLWTNEKIPISVLTEINSRLETATLYNLPTAMPLLDLLKKVEEGTLYETDEISQPEQCEESYDGGIIADPLPPIPDMFQGNGSNRVTRGFFHNIEELISPNSLRTNPLSNITTIRSINPPVLSQHRSQHRHDNNNIVPFITTATITNQSELNAVFDRLRTAAISMGLSEVSGNLNGRIINNIPPPVRPNIDSNNIPNMSEEINRLSEYYDGNTLAETFSSNSSLLSDDEFEENDTDDLATLDDFFNIHSNSSSPNSTLSDNSDE